MDYPMMDFEGMLNAFTEMREYQNNITKTPKGIDGVNTGELSDEDLDTSEWFK